MQTNVSISYFNRKNGPIVYYSYPEDGLNQEEKEILADNMGQATKEGFFSHKFDNFSSLNNYIEIESEWARGKKDILMLSVIIDEAPEARVEKQIKGWEKSIANRFKSEKKIYKAFYSLDDPQVSESDRSDIMKFNENLKSWVKELYGKVTGELQE